MKKVNTLFFVLLALSFQAQNPIQEVINSRLVDLHEVSNADENFVGFEQIKEAIGDAKIVMLGEQSHGDATTYDTKIKLIKYLHQEMGFEILAFESDIYSCHKAWSLMQQGHDVKDAIGKGIFGIWSMMEDLNPLYEYFERKVTSENSLMLAGFDPQIMGKLAADYFIEDLTIYLTGLEGTGDHRADLQRLETFITRIRNMKKGKKKNVAPNMAFLQKTIALIQNQQADEQSDFWVQTLKSLEVFISDTHLKTDDRDQQMANNLIWLKEKYPDKKIICWGATSHFLYNSALIKFDRNLIEMVAGDYYFEHDMMGDYLKKKYGEEIYTIGFIAQEGSFGFHKIRPVPAASENSLEYLIGKSEKDNYFLPLKNLTLSNYLSRPLGHQYMTTDISKVMDGVVFNRYMRPPVTDWEFMLYITPENKMRAKKKERFIREYRLEKEAEKKLKEAQQKEPERA